MESGQFVHDSYPVGISYVDRLAFQLLTFRAWHDFALYNEDKLIRIALYASVQEAAGYVAP